MHYFLQWVDARMNNLEKFVCIPNNRELYRRTVFENLPIPPDKKTVDFLLLVNVI
jgi:hypothetical protein